MSNPTNQHPIELTNDELFPPHRFLVPDKFANQDQGLWYGFFSMVEDFIADEAMDEDYVPELIEIFGVVPDNQKFNWMDKYEEKLSELATYSSIALEAIKEQNTKRQIDHIYNMIPDDKKMEFLNLLFEGNIPPELLEEVEYTPENATPEDIIAKYRENGLTLGTGTRSTFANNNRTAMTTEELAGLLDKMSSINQELTTQIKEQPVTTASVVGEKSANPFMNFGDKIGKVIDGQTQNSPKPEIVQANRVISRSEPMVQVPNPLRNNQNLVNQPNPARLQGNQGLRSANANPQPFTLPSIPTGGNTISRLTQARRASTTQSSQNFIPQTQVPTEYPANLPIRPQSGSNPTAPTSQVQESTAQKLKQAIKLKKEAEANNTPTNRPTVSL